MPKETGLNGTVPPRMVGNRRSDLSGHDAPHAASPSHPCLMVVSCVACATWRECLIRILLMTGTTDGDRDFFFLIALRNASGMVVPGDL